MDRSMPLRIAQAAAMLCRVVRDMAAARLVLARFAVLGLASLAVAGCVSTPPVQTPAHYKAVVVDVSVLRAKGLGLYADRVQAAMAGSAARIFAGLVHPDDRNAPTRAPDHRDPVHRTDGRLEGRIGPDDRLHGRRGRHRVGE